MQKDAWINTMTSVVLGAVCVLLRWLQNENTFDAETGLATAGATLSWMLGILLLLSVLACWVLSRRLSYYDAPTEPEIALADPPKGLVAVLGAAAVMAAIGSILLFFSASSLLMRFTALLGLIAVPALMLFPFLPQWGGLGAVMSLGPVAFFGFWLVISYREHAVNPVLWSYAPLVLAIAAMLLATYRLAAYLYYRAVPHKVVFACCTAPVFCLCILMDTAAGMARMILGAWAVGVLAIAGLLILNMRLPEHSDEEED